MSDNLLTLLAVSIEFGVPIILLAALARVPRFRRRVVVVLGAITPVMLFYVDILFAYVRNPTNTGNRFAFYAGWEMTLAAFLLSLILGILLSFVPRPANLYGRYGLACSIVFAMFVLMDRAEISLPF